MKISPIDHRQYDTKTLKNGIKFITVSDEKCSSSAIALKLDSGSFNDPDDCPGLAHLLEHCLFTGSRNYPQDNALTQYLDQHNGQLNAWTSGNTSAFYCKVHTPFLGQTSDMFFDMLLQPLFSVAGIEKEIKAIDAEFKHKIVDEQRRVLEVQKETCNPAHPFAKFTVGNAHIYQRFSLSELQEKLVDVWRQSFVAENISVCVYTHPEQQQNLRKIVEYLEQFASQTQVQVKTPLPPLYTKAQLQKHINITTKRPHQRLIMTFNLNKSQLSYRSKLEDLLSHLIGYEGEGSLLNLWKHQKWATQIMVGTGLFDDNSLEFNLYIELTPSGTGHVAQMVQDVLDFVSLIKSSTDIELHYQEKAILNEIAFTHQPQLSPLDTALKLVKTLGKFPDDELLCGEFLMTQFSPTEMDALLASFRIDNMRLLSINNHSHHQMRSHWYGVPYSIAQIAEPKTDEQQSHRSKLSLPPKNPYVPDLARRNNDPKQKTLPQRHCGKIWTGLDNISAVQKGECFFSWLEPKAQYSLPQIAMKKLYASVLSTRLNEHFYQAQLAGLHYHFYSHQRGFGLHCSGFADKQLSLSSKILSYLGEPADIAIDFPLLRNEYLTTLQSNIRNKPLNRLFSALQVICVEASWLPEDLSHAIAEIQLPDLLAFTQTGLRDHAIEALLYGDWQNDELDQFAGTLSGHQSTATSASTHTVNLLNTLPYRSFHFQCKHPDSALVYYLQAPGQCLKNHVYTMLVEQMLAGFYFDWMRNKKQLGYQAGTGFMPFNEHPGISLFIQSSSASPGQLYDETRHCLMAFYQWLQALDGKSWQSYQKSLARQADNQNIQFQIQCQRYWTAIGRDPVDFEYEQHVCELVLRTRSEDVAHWFGQHCLSDDKGFALYSSDKQQPDPASFTAPLPDIYHYKHNPVS